jgi:hypothetical protein
MTSILLIIALILNFIAALYFVYRKAFNRGFKNGTEQMIDGLRQIAIDLDDPRFTVRVRQLDPESSKTANPPKYPFDYKTEEEFLKIVEKNYPPNDIDPYS